MNPYASYLGSRDPRQAIRETARTLAALAETIGSRISDSPAPGKWSAREIICHLADCEIVFAFRLRQAASEDNHVIQPFDQEKWAAAYTGYDVSAALAVFSAVRGWNLAFLQSLPSDAFDRKVTHPERGEMTLQTIVETMGGHDLNHIGQLERIAGQASASA